MEGLVDAASVLVAAIVKGSLQPPTYQEETSRLARFCTKLGLIITELGLCLQSDEALRGSRAVFVAVDATVNALRQAEQLMAQCAGTKPSSIWPLEDAIAFQSVTAELTTAAAGLAALGEHLPQDVREDAEHVYTQFKQLDFSQAELSETEGLEMEQVQHQNAASPGPATPPSGSASHVADASQAASFVPPAATHPTVAAPPAAPAHQFTNPEAALLGGALAVSHVAAARASQDAAPALAEAEQRHALQAAAAVATEAVADVLCDEDGGEVRDTYDAQMAPEPVEEQAPEVVQDMLEEIAAADDTALVVTREGETALPSASDAKGAVSGEGASPLPTDPFDMSSGTAARLQSSTLTELKGIQDKTGQEREVDADTERQLDASSDTLSLYDQRHGVHTEGSQVFPSLQHLQDNEGS